METQKSFKKNYVGKGTKVENLNIVKITVKVEDLLKHKHEFKGEEYVTMEVAEMKKPDDYKRTHTVYVSTLEPVEETKE